MGVRRMKQHTPLYYLKQIKMRHLKKALFLVFILIFWFITSLYMIKKYYLVDMVHARIEETIGEHIENDFQFTFDNFTINLISRKITFSGFNLALINKTDTVGHFKGNVLIHLQGWKNIIFDNQKNIKNIVLKESSIQYAQDYPLIIKSKNEGDDQEIKITNVSAVGKLLLVKKYNEQNGRLTSDFNISVVLNYNSQDEFNIDDFIKQVTTFEVAAFHYYLPEGFYQVTISEVSFTDFDHILLKQVVLNPVDSRKTFSIKKKVATDYISVSIDSIQLFNFDKQINERIFVDQIQVFQPSLDVFKDKNFPDSKEYTAILVDLLREMKTPVYVRRLKLSNMFIKYSELPIEAEESGELFFSEANATISNITNVKDSLQNLGNIFIEAEAKFYGEGMLKSTMSYQVLSNTGKFDIKGSLGSMNIVKVNAILGKLLAAGAESGQLDNLRFNFAGTRTQSIGQMWFEYSDLHIKVLELDYLNSSFTRKIVSSTGNMVLRNSNPSSNGVFNVGEINQERDTTKSMFNYWWISLKSGFISSMGVTAEEKKINYKTGETATLLDKIGVGNQ